MSVTGDLAEGPGDGSGRRWLLRAAQVAVVGMAVGLALWGVLYEAPVAGPFVAVSAVGCGGSAVADGFVVADDLVVTAAHSVAGRPQVAVTDSRGRARHGFVVALDAEQDVAAVRVPGLRAEPSALATGDELALAPPDSDGFVMTVSGDGDPELKPFRVTRWARANIGDIYRTVRVSRRALELSYAGGRGDSGAAVVNADGVVVGMVFATSRSRPNISYAVRTVEITEALAELSNSPLRTPCP